MVNYIILYCHRDDILMSLMLRPLPQKYPHTVHRLAFVPCMQSNISDHCTILKLFK